MEFKANLQEYIKQATIYKENLFKAYAFLWEKCTKGMQSKIASRKDYETKIYNNPINLLKSIKQHSLNYQETRYEMPIVSDSIHAFINAKQKDNKSLHDFTRRFKTCKDVTESHLGGPIVIKRYIQTLPEYENLMEGMQHENNFNGTNTEVDKDLQSESEDETETKSQATKTQHKIDLQKRYLIKKAAERLYAFIYLENLDQTKYGKAVKTLNQQKSFGNNQFPNTIVEASEILSNHNYENHKHKQAQRQNKINNANHKNNEKIENADKDIPIPTLSFAQLEVRCYLLT